MTLRVEDFRPSPPCSCPECTPGPGIDYQADERRRAAAREARMREQWRGRPGSATVRQEWCQDCGYVVLVKTEPVEGLARRQYTCVPEHHTWQG